MTDWVRTKYTRSKKVVYTRSKEEAYAGKKSWNRLLSLCFIIAMVMILLASFSSAIKYNIKTVCNTPYCVVGQNATFEISVENEGTGQIELTAFELIDYYSTNTVASYIYEGLPTDIYSDAPGGIKIETGKTARFDLRGTLPQPIEYRKIIFFPCFEIATKKGDIYYQPRGIHSVRYCTKVNESIYAVSCTQDGHCSENENCIANNCISFSCADCEYVINHSCKRHECCSAEECQPGQYCYENKCATLVCEEDEMYLNHSCSRLRCRQDQYLLNHSCIDLKCNNEEAGINHTCQKLSCKEDEFLEPHNCAKLNCTESQGYSNHACVELNCSQDETFVKHACKKIECFFFQDAIEHKCVNNKKLIIKSSIEGFAILLIILFIVLDVLKVEKKI